MNTQQQQQQQQGKVGPRAKCDQVVYEAICKACEIIVGSRSSSTGNGAATTATSATTTQTSTTQPRFNLQIPELLGIRNVVSQYRWQLQNIPIRLDVYYNTTNTNTSSSSNSSSRVLLERWCIEYKSSVLSTGNSTEGLQQQQQSVDGYRTTTTTTTTTNNSDPMIQLTHVCKRIVIWLRTLYCYTRLLPAQPISSGSPTNAMESTGGGGGSHHNPIGFSIYVNTDFTMDDIGDLVTNHGFVYPNNNNNNNHNSTSSSGIVNPPGFGTVTTPYGELSWQVVYAPASKIEAMIPNIVRRSTVRFSNNNIYTARTIQQQRSKPIPVAGIPQTNTQSVTTTSSNFAPRSAPSTSGMMAVLSYAERSQQKLQQAALATAAATVTTTTTTAVPQQQQHRYNVSQGKSYDPNRHRHLIHHASDISTREQQRQQTTTTTAGIGSSNYIHHQHHPPLIQRSQTTIGNSSSLPIRKAPPPPDNNKQPERVMSGLSLALLMASNENDVVHEDDHHQYSTAVDHHNSSNMDKSLIRETTTTATDNNNNNNNNNDDGVRTIGDRIAAAMQIQDKDDSDDGHDVVVDGSNSSYKTRRAALHQMPAHHLLLQQQQQQEQQQQQQQSLPGTTNNNDDTNAFGEYGYGYNNHIPWQKIHPSQSTSQSNPTQPNQLFVQTNRFGARTPTELSTSPSNNSYSSNINNTTIPVSPIQPHFITNSSNHSYTAAIAGRDVSPMGGAYFLRATPPTGIGSGGLGHFIPPRNRTDSGSMNSKSVTPPFQSRPTGFIAQPPTMLLDPSPTAAGVNTISRMWHESSNGVAQDQQQSRSTNATTVSSKRSPSSGPPISSLDALRSSPFQQAHQQQEQDSRSMMFTSLAHTAASVLPPSVTTAGMESDYLTAPMSLAPSFLSHDVSSPSASVLRRSLWGYRSSSGGGGSGVMPSSLAGFAGRHQHSYVFDEQNTHHASDDDDYYSEEMPFAVETPMPSILDGQSASISSQQQQQSKGVAAASKTAVGASSTFGTSSSLATLAQKCSVPNQRLKMFDKQQHGSMVASLNKNGQSAELEDYTLSASSLADQLQEFRTFGASLHVSSSVVFQPPPPHETNAHQNFGGGGGNDIDRNVLSGSGTSSTSTPISLQT